MKIINQLTLRYLKQNKKRTILTILCIALSVIMISCVSIVFYSGQSFYKSFLEKTVGDYHYIIVDDDIRNIDLIKNDERVKEYYFSCTKSYYLDDENEYYLNLKCGDNLYFQKENYRSLIKKGNLPSHPHEIAISQQYLDNCHLHKDIGDTITLYRNEEEKQENSFEIVGIIDNYEAQSYFKSSFNALSYIDLHDSNEYYTMYVADKEVSSEIFHHVNELEEKINLMKNENKDIEDEEQYFTIRYNSSYLAIQNIFEENSQSRFLIVYNMIALILVIIILISVFIIYQAFNLSTNDRVHYLGMLSSVGATPKQKKYSVYYEGFVLSLIAIPLGIIISFIGLFITFFFINQLESIKIIGIQIKPKISLLYLMIIIVLSLITIFISLYLPARKISRISVIDALRRNDEIKIKTKRLKKKSFLQKHLNISQNIALRNYKRQGKRSKVIVFSLVVSMISFISVFSFGQNLMKQSNEANIYDMYDIYITINNDNLENTNQLLNHNEKVDNYFCISDPIHTQIVIDDSYLTFPIEKIKDSHIQEHYYNEQEIEHCMYLVGMDEESIKKVCKDNDIDYKENTALIYNGPFVDYNLKNNEEIEYKTRLKKFDDNFFKVMIATKQYQSSQTDMINGVAYSDLLHFDNYQLIDKNYYSYLYHFNTENQFYMIIPIDDAFHIISSLESLLMNDDIFQNSMINYYIFSKNHVELTKELKSLNYDPFDYAQSVLQNRQMFLIIEVFIYGFACIMIIFSLINIINMMSASIDKRKHEFGMLLSVGMSSKDIQKMIFYESFIYGIKTLFYGLPISILIEWIFFENMNMVDVKFVPSIIAYVISFIVIIVVMLLTFRVGLNQFKKQNIIETLKDDM